MKKHFGILILLVVSAMSAIAQNTETRELSSFTELSVGEAINVILVPGSKNEAVIKARNIDLDDVETNVSGGRLKIELNGTRHNNIDVEVTNSAVEAYKYRKQALLPEEGGIRNQTVFFMTASQKVEEIKNYYDSQEQDKPRK